MGSGDTHSNGASVAKDILETFEEASHPPTGRRFFDGEAGAPAFRPAKVERDWGKYIVEHTQRGGPDECHLWKGGGRVTIEDGRGRRQDGKRVNKKPSVALDFRRLIWREVHGSLPKGFVFSTCGETWCANPRHMSDKSKDRPRRKVTILGKRGSIESRTLSIVPTPSPMVGDTPEAALHAILDTLRRFPIEQQRRIIRCVSVFYGLDEA